MPKNQKKTEFSWMEAENRAIATEFASARKAELVGSLASEDLAPERKIQHCQLLADRITFDQQPVPLLLSCDPLLPLDFDIGAQRSVVCSELLKIHGRRLEISDLLFKTGNRLSGRVNTTDHNRMLLTGVLELAFEVCNPYPITFMAGQRIDNLPKLSSRVIQVLPDEVVSVLAVLNERRSQSSSFAELMLQVLDMALSRPELSLEISVILSKVLESAFAF
eukprot:jgi/Phyca11/16910/fgenesh1_pg.PHYCAscaffold_23_\